MKSLFDTTTRGGIRERLLALTPESKGKWGKLTPATLMAHLIDAMAISFGERAVEVKRGFLSTALGKWMIIDAPMPWPEGTPTSPEFLVSKPTEFAQDKARILEYLDRFAKGRLQPWGQSPIMGTLTPEQWARLQYRHLNHHLVQFGV